MPARRRSSWDRPAAALPGALRQEAARNTRLVELRQAARVGERARSSRRPSLPQNQGHAETAIFWGVAAVGALHRYAAPAGAGRDVFRSDVGAKGELAGALVGGALSGRGKVHHVCAAWGLEARAAFVTDAGRPQDLAMLTCARWISPCG